jgi:hypothetical protein
MRSAAKVSSAKVGPTAHMTTTAAVPKRERASAGRHRAKRHSRGKREDLLAHQSLSFSDLKSPIPINPRAPRWFQADAENDQMTRLKLPDGNVGVPTFTRTPRP